MWTGKNSYCDYPEHNRCSSAHHNKSSPVTVSLFSTMPLCQYAVFLFLLVQLGICCDAQNANGSDTSTRRTGLYYLDLDIDKKLMTNESLLLESDILMDNKYFVRR